MADLNFTMISTAFLVRNQLEVYRPHLWEELQLISSLKYILLKAGSVICPTQIQKFKIKRLKVDYRDVETYYNEPIDLSTIEDLWRKNLWRKIPGRELFRVVEDCWVEL